MKLFCMFLISFNIRFVPCCQYLLVYYNHKRCKRVFVTNFQYCADSKHVVRNRHQKCDWESRQPASALIGDQGFFFIYLLPSYMFITCTLCVLYLVVFLFN
jgi:hypothetical protein